MKSFPLEPIEKASLNELRALQLKRLQTTLRHAYRQSPVYRAKFDSAGVHPGDCRTLADLAKFPFTTKQDFRDSYPFGMLAVSSAAWVKPNGCWTADAERADSGDSRRNFHG